MSLAFLVLDYRVGSDCGAFDPSGLVGFLIAFLLLSFLVGGGSACGVKQSLKIHRASGECLGAVCRRRTCQAAIRGRELQAGYDLPISEWGNPAGVMTRHL